MDEQLTAPRNINGVSLGPLALETMRFADRGLTKEELINLFSYLYNELGVNADHN